MRQICTKEGKLNNKMEQSIGFANDLHHARKSVAFGSVSVESAVEFLEHEEGRSFDSMPVLQSEIKLCLITISEGNCPVYISTLST